MENKITNKLEYIKWVKTLVEDVIEAYFEQDSDYRDLYDALHGVCDRETAYYSVIDEILYFTDNEDYFEEVGVELNTENGWQAIKNQVAFWALQEDILERIDGNRLERISDYLIERANR